MKQIVNELSAVSPTDEPAAAYYKDVSFGSGTTLSGKWTLIYTDAPDITSLEGGPLSKCVIFGVFTATDMPHTSFRVMHLLFTSCQALPSSVKSDRSAHRPISKM